MKQLLAAAAILSAIGGTAMAQTNGTANPNIANAQQQLSKTLEQAGFTNVKVMPDSYLVQAKDKDGHPVNMFISPNSVTEVMAVPGNGAQGTNAAANGAAPTGGGMFTNVPATDKISSNIVGLDVYNNSKQDIGTIKDLVLDGGQLRAFIVGVGGFIGMGEHYVAVAPNAMNITFDHGDNKWHAVMNTTADQLKAAPEFKYPPRG